MEASLLGQSFVRLARVVSGLQEFRRSSANGDASHLLFDVAIRICIELRLKMPFVFSVVEIPSKLFLMVVDVLLVLNITRPIVCMTMRLNNCDGLWNLLFRPLLLLGYVNLGILYFAERIGGIYKMYTLSFNWDKADPQYYANILLSYGSTLVWFGIFLFLGALISFNKSRPAQRNAENCKDRIPCGKVSEMRSNPRGHLLTIL